MITYVYGNDRRISKYKDGKRIGLVINTILPGTYCMIASVGTELQCLSTYLDHTLASNEEYTNELTDLMTHWGRHQLDVSEFDFTIHLEGIASILYDAATSTHRVSINGELIAIIYKYPTYKPAERTYGSTPFTANDGGYYRVDILHQKILDIIGDDQEALERFSLRLAPIYENWRERNAFKETGTSSRIGDTKPRQQ